MFTAMKLKDPCWGTAWSSLATRIGVKATTRQRAKQQRHAVLENLTAGRQNIVAQVSAGRMKA